MNKSLICVLLTAMMFVAGCGDESSGSKNDGGDSLCGNQTIDDGEQCDDGNAFDGDGCSQNCVVEPGWKCPSEGGACSQEPPVEPASECGNSKVETGESCDDGNRVSGDGCSGNCQIEEGWSCPQEGQACEHIPSCGDGLVEGDEQCDDHNAVSGDGCSSECRIEEGFQCPIEGQACTPMTCGNGQVDKDMGEVCDSGSDNVEYGGFLKLCGTNCQWAHYCGDGLLDEVDIKNGEECDRMGVEDDYNGCSSDCKRVNFCGDGKVTHEEACDDGNLANGDGCSEHCTIEDNFKCDIVNGQSHCTEFPCGNGKLDENETCDDGNRISGDGCSASCYLERGYLCEGTVCTSVIGNGKLEPESGEQCDDGNTISGDGCSSTGVLEAGWYCPTPGSPCIARACGDGIVAGNEECDDGNTDDYDGCSYRCEIETGWNCVDGKNCVEGYCGDGIVQVGEECDNDIVALYSTPASGDGCSSSCTIEPGYACMSQGGECKTVVCGDGTIDPGDSFTSYETCDLGENLNDGSAGCAADCTIVKGWACDDDGKNCASGQCGDGILQAGEECDDGNTMPGDGCSPKCTIETGLRCENGSCKPICGDGVTMWMLLDHAEECDDGNLVNGDGCSSDCKIETGFTCTEFSQAAVPDFIAVPVVYRDFRSTNRDVYSETNADGFITDELIKKYPGAKWSNRLHKTMTDFDAQSGCPKTGYTLSTLDEDHKPVLSQDAFGTCFSSKTEFGLWYRNVPGLNKEVKHKLHMWLTDNASKSYYFTSDKPTTNNAPNTLTDGTAWSFPGFFLPIGPSDGFGPTGGWNDRNYSFTSEVTTYFQYKGNETLKFSGDDDLWVFLNGHLFVDLGGLHAIQDGSNTLKAETCDVVDKDGNTKQIACDPNFEVYEGGVYELKLFHAERNATGSNFSLTLTGFLNSGTASCSAICGDGLVMGDEQCDPIAVEEAVAELMTKENIDEKTARTRVNEQVAFLGCVNCQNVAYCGNGKIEEGEQCDLGTESTEWCDKENIDECDDSQWCSRSQCKLTDSVCGNGIKEGHEECDGNDGVNQDQTCLETCRISGCGDGIVDQSRGEECDDGNDSNEDACTTSCRHPFCGDGIVSTYLGEVCDDGPDGNDGAYGHCGLGCTYWAPRCGDGHVDVENGEVCDDGVNNGEYNGCMPGCQSLPARCGDGITQEEHGETCDDGEDNGKGSCSTACIQVIN